MRRATQRILGGLGALLLVATAGGAGWLRSRRTGEARAAAQRCIEAVSAESPFAVDEIAKCAAHARAEVGWPGRGPSTGEEALALAHLLDLGLARREVVYWSAFRPDRAARRAALDALFALEAPTDFGFGASYGDVPTILRILDRPGTSAADPHVFGLVASRGDLGALDRLAQRPSPVSAVWRCLRGDVAGGRAALRADLASARPFLRSALACGIPLEELSDLGGDDPRLAARRAVRAVGERALDPARGSEARRALEGPPRSTDLELVAIALETYDATKEGTGPVLAWIEEPPKPPPLDGAAAARVTSSLRAQLAEPSGYRDPLDRWIYLRPRERSAITPKRLLEAGGRLEALAAAEPRLEKRAVLRDGAWSMYVASATEALSASDLVAARAAGARAEAVADPGDLATSIRLRHAAEDPEGAATLARAAEAEPGFAKRESYERANVIVLHARALSALGRFDEAYALVVAADDAFTQEAGAERRFQDDYEALTWTRWALALRTGHADVPIAYLDRKRPVDGDSCTFPSDSSAMLNPVLWRLVRPPEAARALLRGQLAGRLKVETSIATPMMEVLASAVGDGDAETFLDWRFRDQRPSVRRFVAWRADAAAFRGDVTAAAEWSRRARVLRELAKNDPTGSYFRDLGL